VEIKVFFEDDVVGDSCIGDGLGSRETNDNNRKLKLIFGRFLLLTSD